MRPSLGIETVLERVVAELHALATRVARIAPRSSEHANRLAEEVDDITDYAASLRAKPIGVAVHEGRSELAIVRAQVEVLEREHEITAAYARG